MCIQRLENVQQKTIEPLIKKALIPGTLIYTDEYNIYGRLEAWGYAHAVVHHGQGEFARDDDQDGFCEVQVNTIEGLWSLLRSWLRPHRGISQEKLPLYLGFFDSFITLSGQASLKAFWEQGSIIFILTFILNIKIRTRHDGRIGQDVRSRGD